MVAFKEDITEEKAQVANAIASSIDNFLMSGNYKDMPYSLGTYNWIQDPDGKDICLMLPCRDITRTIQARISAKKNRKNRQGCPESISGTGTCKRRWHDDGWRKC